MRPDARTGLAFPDVDAAVRAAAWTPDEAADAVDAALAGDFPSPLRVRDALAGWFRQGDAACPGEGTFMAGPSFEGCTSAAGWYYLGVGGYTETFVDDGAYVELALMGDLTIIAPDGPYVDIGGHWLASLRPGPDWYVVWNGSWVEPHSPLDWLAAGTSAWLTTHGYPAESARGVSLDGGLTLRGTTLGFRDVALGADGCRGVPKGALTVLDPSGGTWVFEYGEGCVPCASVSFDGAGVDTAACPTVEGLAERVLASLAP